MKDYKKIFYILLGGIIFSSITVIAAALIQSNEVLFDVGQTGVTDTNGNGIVDVQDAINELYNRSGGSSGMISFDAQGGNIDSTAPIAAGALPTPTKTGKCFLGWYTEANGGTRITSKTIISEPTTAYAHWVDTPSSFSTDSWETIACAVRNDNLSNYNLGDTKEVQIDLDGNGTIANTEKYKVRLSNKSTPAVCSTPGFSQTACGVVIEFEDIITNRVFHSSDSNSGGYPSSTMKTYLNGTLYNKLPTNLKDIIIETYTVSGHGDGNYLYVRNYASMEYLYLLSYVELFNANIDYDTVKNDETRVLDYYTGNSSTKLKKYNGTTAIWWTRTANPYTSTKYFTVSTSGTYVNYEAYTYSYGVAPAFRIG